MKKLIFFLLLVSAVTAHAQQQYITQTDIQYYPDSINAKDGYTASQCKLDLYYPKDVKDVPTIIWFHGGSLTGGGKEIPKTLMEKGYIVISVQYRLSPKVKAPAYIEDAAAAVAWAYQHVSNYGGDTKLIFLTGHSAGGYLDLMITLDKKYLAKYNIDANSFAAVIPFSPQCITHFTIRHEEGIRETQPTIDNYAPLYFVRADTPPILLITGDRELELYGRYEENAYMQRMFKLNGNKRTTLYELQGFDHGGMPEPAFPLLLKEVAQVTKEIKAQK